jgi:hypothetical protein
MDMMVQWYINIELSIKQLYKSNTTMKFRQDF